jgi:hypothetical protein
MFWDVGTFTKAASVATTLSIAEDALTRANFQVFFNAQQGGFIVIGGNATVIVAVSVAPLADGTFVAVTATSENGSAAEQARNQVRQLIQEIVPID